MNRRGFLQAFAALAGSLTIPGSVSAIEPTPAPAIQPAVTIQWAYRFFDFNMRFGVGAVITLPSGVSVQQAVAFKLPRRRGGRFWHTVDEVRSEAPEVFERARIELERLAKEYVS